MDPCYSWFGCRRVELRGHTGAPPRSQLSFPHSEQSASEHLEHRGNIKRLLRPKTHMHTHTLSTHIGQRANRPD